MDIYFLFGYMGVGILLAVRAKYLDEQLMRYIDRQYPEEGKFIRSHEWQAYPWAKWGKVMRELIKKHRSSDAELARLAKKLNHSTSFFLAWLALLLLMITVLVIYKHVFTPTN
jgi:hypothetical protein